MKADHRPMHVTQPFLPPLQEFQPYLERIWETRILTNGGPLHEELEEALRLRLDVPFLSLVGSGTAALILALRALTRAPGEVVTTPYSFVATAGAIVHCGLTPVFADIDPQTLNLSPAAAEAAITGRTVAILPVHGYGLPCDVAGFEALGRRHNLPVLYDGAAATTRMLAGRSLASHGTACTLSFHATKLFHSFEGGAVISHSAEMKRSVDQLRNFGYIDETMIEQAGINAKLNEISAAMGLLQLRQIDRLLARQHAISARYQGALAGIDGLRIHLDAQGEGSHGYFPVMIAPPFPVTRDALYHSLRAAGILVRRYYYPLITDFAAFRHHATRPFPAARAAAEQVICLPFHPALTDDDVDRVTGHIRSLAGL